MRKTTKTPETPLDVPLIQLSETCFYCQRVIWGDVQYLGKGNWRHSDCYPGSNDWLEYYERLPDSKRTSEMKAIYQYYKR